MASPRSSGILRPPFGLLAAVGCIAALFTLCLKVWSEVAEGDARALDRRILLGLRVPGHPETPLGPPWLRQSMIDISALGGFTLLSFLVLAACGYLLIRGARGRALLLAAAAASGMGLGVLLKDLFGRPRPEIVAHLVDVQTLSFPSGHATNSALVYLTIAALASDVEPGRTARIYIMTVAIFLTMLIGFSRLYLGVHWPSDVVAGWAVGAAWALAWRLVGSRIG